MDDTDDQILDIYSSKDGYAEDIMRQTQAITFQWKVEQGGTGVTMTPVVPEGMELLESSPGSLTFRHSVDLPGPHSLDSQEATESV